MSQGLPPVAPILSHHGRISTQQHRQAEKDATDVLEEVLLTHLASVTTNDADVGVCTNTLSRLFLLEAVDNACDIVNEFGAGRFRAMKFLPNPTPKIKYALDCLTVRERQLRQQARLVETEMQLLQHARMFWQAMAHSSREPAPGAMLTNWCDVDVAIKQLAVKTREMDLEEALYSRMASLRKEIAVASKSGQGKNRDGVWAALDAMEAVSQSQLDEKTPSLPLPTPAPPMRETVTVSQATLATADAVDTSSQTIESALSARMLLRLLLASLGHRRSNRAMRSCFMDWGRATALGVSDRGKRLHIEATELQRRGFENGSRMCGYWKRVHGFRCRLLMDIFSEWVLIWRKVRRERSIIGTIAPIPLPENPTQQVSASVFVDKVVATDGGVTGLSRRLTTSDIDNVDHRSPVPSPKTTATLEPTQTPNPSLMVPSSSLSASPSPHKTSRYAIGVTPSVASVFERATPLMSDAPTHTTVEQPNLAPLASEIASDGKAVHKAEGLGPSLLSPLSVLAPASSVHVPASAESGMDDTYATPTRVQTALTTMGDVESLGFASPDNWRRSPHTPPSPSPETESIFDLKDTDTTNGAIMEHIAPALFDATTSPTLAQVALQRSPAKPPSVQKDSEEPMSPTLSKLCLQQDQLRQKRPARDRPIHQTKTQATRQSSEPSPSHRSAVSFNRPRPGPELAPQFQIVAANTPIATDDAGRDGLSLSDLLMGGGTLNEYSKQTSPHTDTRSHHTTGSNHDSDNGAAPAKSHTHYSSGRVRSTPPSRSRNLGHALSEALRSGQSNDKHSRLALAAPTDDEWAVKYANQVCTRRLFRVWRPWARSTASTRTAIGRALARKLLKARRANNGPGWIALWRRNVRSLRVIASRAEQPASARETTGSTQHATAVLRTRTVLASASAIASGAWQPITSHSSLKTDGGAVSNVDTNITTPKHNTATNTAPHTNNVESEAYRCGKMQGDREWLEQRLKSESRRSQLRKEHERASEIGSTSQSFLRVASGVGAGTTATGASFSSSGKRVAWAKNEDVDDSGGQPDALSRLYPSTSQSPAGSRVSGASSARSWKLASSTNDPWARAKQPTPSPSSIVGRQRSERRENHDTSSRPFIGSPSASSRISRADECLRCSPPSRRSNSQQTPNRHDREQRVGATKSRNGQNRLSAASRTGTNQSGLRGGLTFAEFRRRVVMGVSDKL